MSIEKRNSIIDNHGNSIKIVFIDELSINGNEVEAIITEHLLKQFPQYKNAVISVNGILNTVTVKVKYSTTDQQGVPK